MMDAPSAPQPDGSLDSDSTARPDAGMVWQDLLAARRLNAAHKAFLMDRAVAEAALADPQGIDSLRRALGALADVEDLVRDRSFTRAAERLRRLDERIDLVPWSELEADLAALEASAKLLDRRELEALFPALDDLESSWFKAEVETQRGTAMIYEGRLEEAKAAFEAALAQDPDHYRAITNLGNVALEEKRTDDAIDYYQRALKVNDSFANAHHNLGVAYRRKGNLSKSVKSLKAAQRLAQKRDASEARTKLGRLTASPGVTRYFRWLLIGAAGALLYYLFLRNP